MDVKDPIKQLTINGFKSIQKLERLDLSGLNVLIGANGAGKSNFVSFFRMLGEMMELRLQRWTARQGSADRIVSFGVKETQKVESFIEFGGGGYKFELEPSVEGGFSFVNELLYSDGSAAAQGWTSLGTAHKETVLASRARAGGPGTVEGYCHRSLAAWKVFHFHDTSETAGMKRWGALQDNDTLWPDASNLAAFLFRLKGESPTVYAQIRKTVQLAIPFFDDFVLRPRMLETGEEQIRLLWQQKDSAYSLWPSQLSDGSIRFICLATALLQPDPPSTIIIDEPELGLHPYAIALLGALLRSASHRMQVIVSTQSVPLVNEFAVDDLIVVERENGASVFKRHKAEDFKAWLEEYSVGELWEKNILGGRP